MSKSICKIKMVKGQLEVHVISHHEVGDKVKNTVQKIKSELSPHGDFIVAFKGLRKYFIQVCELTVFKNGISEEVLDRHEMVEMNIKQSDGNTLITLEATRELNSKKKIKIKSPEIDLYNDQYFEMDKLQSDVEEAILEAERFLDGKNGEKQIDIKFAA